MLPRLTVVFLMYFYALCCVCLENVGDSDDLKNIAKARSDEGRPGRHRRDVLAGDDYIWNDDNRIDTPRPALDTDIVYGRVENAPRRVGIVPVNRKYLELKPDSAKVEQRSIGDDGSVNIQVDKQYRNKHVKETHHEKDGNRISHKVVSKVKPGVKTIVVREGEGGSAFKETLYHSGETEQKMTMIKQDRSGNQIRHKTINTRKHKPVKKITIVHPQSRLVEFHAEKGATGTKVEYTKQKGTHRKKVTVFKGLRNGNPEIRRKIVYDTPSKRKQIVEDIKRDKDGRIIVFKKQRVHHHTADVGPRSGEYRMISQNKPKIGKYRVITTDGGGRYKMTEHDGEEMVKIPLAHLKKLDEDVLHGNEYSRQTANLGKRVFSRKFFNMLYNLTYHSAKDALGNQPLVHKTEVHLKAHYGSRWTAWSSWGHCSVTCGHGQRYRFRKCLPKTSKGPCIGNSVQMKTCRRSCHGGHGAWTDWGYWSKCSSTCGIGNRQRSRNCIDPRSKIVSYDCTGSGAMTETCAVRPCDTGLSGRVIFATEGEQARLTCRYDRSYVVKSVYWVTPAGDSIAKGTHNSRYGIDGDTLVIFHSERDDSGIYKCVVLSLKHGLISAKASMVVIDCASHPCHNGGICVEHISDTAYPFSRFTCQCTTGYYGKRCTLGIGPGGIAACVVGVITAILFIVLVVLFCNHRNAMRVATMRDDEFYRTKNMSESRRKLSNKKSASFAAFPSKKSVPYRKVSNSDDFIARKISSIQDRPTKSTVRQWKAEAETESSTEETKSSGSENEQRNEQLLLVGQKEVLALKPNGNKKSRDVDTDGDDEIESESSPERGREAVNEPLMAKSALKHSLQDMGMQDKPATINQTDKRRRSSLIKDPSGRRLSADHELGMKHSVTFMEKGEKIEDGTFHNIDEHPHAHLVSPPAQFSDTSLVEND